jgi:hypothetical protein
VVLPVTVRDKKGALVTSLKIGDFTLTEDGRPQTIKSFTRESNLPFPCGTACGHEPQRIHRDGKRAQSGGQVCRPDAAGGSQGDSGSRRTLASRQAFLIHFDREVELLEDFTNSRDKLHHELDDMGPTRAEQNTSQGPETSGDDRGSGSGQTRSHGGTQLYDAIYLASHELMEPKDGRKALVVFSDGVDRGSKETLNDAVDAADRANVAVYTIYFKGEQERNSNNGWSRRAAGGMAADPGGYPGGPEGVAIRAAVAAIGAMADRARRMWTARRSWRRLPRAPEAATSKPRRRTIWTRSTADCRGAARPIPADLHAGQGG